MGHLAGLGFIGYAVIFFVRNFTGAFLELGIGPGQVKVDRGRSKWTAPRFNNGVLKLAITLFPIGARHRCGSLGDRPGG
jgi:hypothetical protein